MRDDGGEHDAADDQRPGGVPINPKHVPASVLASSAREIRGNGGKGAAVP
jgi:hypothetical protein